MSNYTNVVLWGDGVLEFDNQSAEVSHPDTDTDVDTIPGGNRGVSVGVRKTSISISNARPYVGASIDWVMYKMTGKQISIELRQIGAGGKRLGPHPFLVREAVITAGGPGQAVVDKLTLQSVGEAPYFK